MLLINESKGTWTNMTKLKMNWTGSDWTLSSVEDTGTSIAHSTKTITSLLSALTMAGFAVSQVVQEDTLTHLLGLKYAPDIANRQRLKLNNLQDKTGQTSGSVSTLWNPMSRVCQQVYSTNLDGVVFQVDSVFLQEYSSLTSTRTETRSNSSRSDTTTQTEDLPSLQDARRQYMVRNALSTLNDTSASQREAETQSSSECVESQPSHCQAHRPGIYYGTSDAFCWSEEPFSWQSATETTQDRSS